MAFLRVQHILSALLFTPFTLSSSIQPSQCARGGAPPHLSFPTSHTVPAPNNPASWLPWTHPPRCIESSETPYCVYTAAHLPPYSRHGISVLTTPELASSSALNPFHSLHDLNDDPAHFFAPEKLEYPPPYEVREVPGKGLGLVATRKIPKGKAIMIDYASVLANVEYPADVMREDVQDLLELAVDQLPEPKSVRGLAIQGKEGVGFVEDVMLTNSFGVAVGGREVMALFTNLARINHNCRPNAFIHFSDTTLAMTLWSAREIQPGEEITITYSPAGRTSKERQRMLKSTWGFECHCELCTSPPEVVNASDANLLEIRRLQNEVLKLAQNGSFQEAVQGAEKMFDLIAVEQLTEHMADLYETAGRLYYHAGNLEKALEYSLKVKHEIVGWGVPGPFGRDKLKMMDNVIKRIERELGEQKKAEEEERKKKEKEVKGEKNEETKEEKLRGEEPKEEKEPQQKTQDNQEES